ncbi:XoxI protein [Peribacillus frigoritolerans]|uniref:XoxI protein n=1 Tax=Peribacillus frigoritolerans TaxID=450367 RepID=UPI0020797A41|nr:XoxI protein [Peribacillus frigoritolerans]USK76646.1 XoxI protein [Peribacillus frigoritolerans]
MVNSQEISFTQVPDGTGSSILAKNKAKGMLDVHSPPLRSTYAVAKSSANRLRDYIYARAKTYNGDGSLIKSKSASATKADFIGVKAMNGTSLDDSAIGTHIYKLKGYKTITDQTKASW